MEDSNQWQSICKVIQQRLLESTALQPYKSKDLRTKIFSCLIKARSEGILSTKIHDIHKLLQMIPSREDNEVDGLRFHIHPGSDDLMIPSAPMDPLEILHLFLYGLQLKGDRKPRSTN